MLPVAFAGGIVVGAVVLRTGSLAAAVGLHAGWNLGTLGASPLREVLAAVASLP
jgi:membrane protease YdiL (CAAX protease family)